MSVKEYETDIHNPRFGMPRVVEDLCDRCKLPLTKDKVDGGLLWALVQHEDAILVLCLECNKEVAR